MRTLVLNLKREYWEAIRNGSKTVEYRLVSDYWRKRLDGKTFDSIELRLGYPRAGDESRIIGRKWRGLTVGAITHSLFGTDEVEVFQIDVSEPLA